MSIHIGVDLTMSSRKKTALAVLDDETVVVNLDKLATDDDILQAIYNFSSATVGIDSPLTLPLGWHCLEEEHGCQPASHLKGRECERQLAKMGIPSYFVTTRCIIRDMVYRGIRLRTSLEERGYTVIEVYPYGSKVQLFGKPIPSKLRKGGLEFLRGKVAQLIPALEPRVETLDHDICDAIMAAYTVFLFSRGETISVGNPREGLVFLPPSARSGDYPGTPFGVSLKENRVH